MSKLKSKIIAYKRCSGSYQVPSFSDPVLDLEGRVLTFDSVREANVWIIHRLGIKVFYLTESPWFPENPPKSWPGDELY